MPPSVEEQLARLLAERRWEAAVRLARGALEADPLRPGVWWRLGEALSGAGRPAAAAACRERASILNPRIEPDSDPPPHDLPAWLRDLLAVPQVTVEAAMIVRDAADTVGEALERLRPAVDRLVVLDTGSEDDTAAIARAAGADVFTAEWQDDFAAARNAALGHVRGDWVLWVDADEFLDPRDVAVPRTVAGLLHGREPAPVVRVVQVNHLGERIEPSYDVARFFPVSAGYRWRGRIHEQVVAPAGSWSSPVWSPVVRIRLHHWGYEADVVARRRKLERNIRLLRRAVEEDPVDVGAWGFLGRELFVAGDYAAAVEVLYEAERRAVDDPLYARLPEVRGYLADALLRLQRVDEAAAVAERLTATAPDYPTGWFLLGQVRIRMAVTQVALAGRAFEQTRTAALRYEGPIGFDHALGDWKADLGLADVARLEGRWRDAIRLYREVTGRVTEASVRAMVERQWKRLVEEARAVATGYARSS